MPGNLVAAVAPLSPAARAGIQQGDEIIAINGEPLRDVIEYQWAMDADLVELEIQRSGLVRNAVLDKSVGESVGIELSSAVFDRVRTCDNHCPFCFIYQLPKGLRPSLYMKDDDYRLSFLYGNFTTLTRFTEADFQRVIEEKLSPLFVSIHATDPELRTSLLRNGRGATSLRWLRLLLDAGVEIHGQIVVCPGINDADALDATFADIATQYSKLATVALVPLGISKFSNGPELRDHTQQEAAAIVEKVGAWQKIFASLLGRRVVFASDEYYLLAKRPFEEAALYIGAELQLENGVGLAARFTQEVFAALGGNAPTAARPKSGFFASVDGAPAQGYRSPTVRAESPRRQNSHITLLTGAYGAKVLYGVVPALSAKSGLEIDVVPVENQFFGGNISVTGLMVGADIDRALATLRADTRILMPDVALSNDRFLDGSGLGDLIRPVEVVRTSGVDLVMAVLDE